jgi:hypothetical protein
MMVGEARPEWAVEERTKKEKIVTGQDTDERNREGDRGSISPRGDRQRGEQRWHSEPMPGGVASA